MENNRVIEQINKLKENNKVLQQEKLYNLSLLVNKLYNNAKKDENERRVGTIL